MVRSFFLLILIAVYLMGAGCSRNQVEQAVREPAVTAAEAQQLYSTDCSPCHGLDGKGTNAGPSLEPAAKMRDSEIVQVIREGKGSMPAWETRLSDAEMAALAKYVKTLVK